MQRRRRCRPFCLGKQIMEVPLPINLFFTLLVLFVSSHIVKSCATSGCFPINIALLWDEETITSDKIDSYAFNDVLKGQLGHENVTFRHVDLSSLSPFEITQKVFHLSKTGTIAFILTLSCERLASLSALASDIGVVMVVATSNECSNVHDGLVHPYTSVTYLPTQVIVWNLVDVLQWTDMTIIYNTRGEEVLEGVLDSGSSSNTTIELYKLTEDMLREDVAHVLLHIQDNPKISRNVLLLCDLPCQTEVIQQAASHDLYNNNQALFTYRVHWLTMTRMRDLPFIEQILGDIDHVSTIIYAGEKSGKIFVKETIAKIIQALENIPFSLNGHDDSLITPGNSSLMDNVTRAIQNHFASLNLKSEEAIYHEVHSAYYGPTRAERYFKKVAEWTPRGLVSYTTVFPNDQYGLNGRHMVTGTNVWAPFVIQSNANELGFQGLCVEMLLELSRSLNFSFNMLMPADGEWGVNRNGNWSGLVGQLQYKEVDIMVAPLTVLAEREQVIDFPVHFFLTYTTLVVALPDPEADKWKLYINPFQWKVWLLLAVAVPLGGIVIWLVTLFSPYYPRLMANKGMALLRNSIIYAYGSLLTQGGPWLPKAQSGRFVVGFWWMYCIVMVAIYSGNLIAFLTVSKTTSPFTSLRELLDSPWRFGVLGGTSWMIDFEAAKGGELKEMWDKMTAWNASGDPVFSLDGAAHYERVNSGKYAYINDKTVLEGELTKHCHLGIIKEEFLPMEYGMGAHNNSAYTDMFSKEIIKMKQSGLFYKWRMKWWPRQTFCTRSDVTESKPVTIKDMQGAYYALGILILTAFLILFIETLYHKQFSDLFSRRKEEEIGLNLHMNGHKAGGRSEAGHVSPGKYDISHIGGAMKQLRWDLSSINNVFRRESLLQTEHNDVRGHLYS